MAININSVYKTVLVVLEQEKRGALLPTEFNKIANQAQQEIFIEYLDDYNQLLRMPQTDLAYADRMALLQEKISLFQTAATLSQTGATGSSSAIQPSDLYKIDELSYTDGSTQAISRIERINRYDLYTINQGSLTSPSSTYPVYIYENKSFTFYPNLAAGVVQINYMKKPVQAEWGFNVDPNLGSYVYNSNISTNFEIHESDEALLVSKILTYAGVTSNDPEAASLGAQKEQQVTANSQK
jgi:hypothetical protein